MALMTETNTRRMEAHVRRSARAAGLGTSRTLQVDFEHGQWWVTNLRTGSQWSACDASGPSTFGGFVFECVTEGDD